MLAPARPRHGLLTARTALVLSIAVPAALLAGAIGSQLIGGLVPCDMCIWQRWPHAAALLLGLLAVPLVRARRLLVGLAALAIAVSGAIGVYHAGVEAGIFPGITTCSTSGGTGLDAIMGGNIVRCDAVQWSLLGISMAGWNALVSLGAASLIALGLWKDRT